MWFAFPDGNRSSFVTFSWHIVLHNNAVSCIPQSTWEQLKNSKLTIFPTFAAAKKIQFAQKRSKISELIFVSHFQSN